MTNDQPSEEVVESAEPPPLTDVPRMTEAALREFINDTLAGRIFTSWGLREEEIARVFMPIGFGAFGRAVTREYAEQIGIVFEYIDKASPVAINGNPFFFSMRVMHRDDWVIALATLRREEERRRNLTLEKPEET